MWKHNVPSLPHGKVFEFDAISLEMTQYYKTWKRMQMKKQTY